MTRPHLLLPALAALALAACLQDKPNASPDAGTPSPDAGTPSPDAGAPSPDAGAAQGGARQALRPGEVALKPLGPAQVELPKDALRDPVGDLRPKWQLLRPKFRGVQGAQAHKDLDYGFCKAMKVGRWFARCEGERGELPAPLDFALLDPGPDQPLTLELSASLGLTSVRGDEPPMRASMRFEVARPAPDLELRVWHQELGRLAAEAWMKGVDQARVSGAAPKGVRWSEFRRLPPALGKPERHADGLFLDGRPWLVDLGPNLVVLHHFDPSGVPITQALQTGPLRGRTQDLAALDHEGKRLLLALPGGRITNPADGPAQDPLMPTCEGKGEACYGVSILALNDQGRVNLAARLPDHLRLSAPLAGPDGALYLVAAKPGAQPELVRFLRGGAEDRRWPVPPPPAGASWRLGWLSDGVLGLALVGAATEDGPDLWGKLRKTPQGPAFRLASVQVAKPDAPKPLLPKGPPLAAWLPSGDGGALVVDGEGSARALSSLAPDGKPRWKTPLPTLGPSLSLSKTSSTLWARALLPQGQARCAGTGEGQPCEPAPQKTLALDPKTGQTLAALDAWMTADPVEALPGQHLACLRERPDQPVVVALLAPNTSKPVARLPLPWGCEALGLLDGGELAVASGWPGGAYRLAPPSEW